MESILPVLKHALHVSNKHNKEEGGSARVPAHLSQGCSIRQVRQVHGWLHRAGMRGTFTKAQVTQEPRAKQKVCRGGDKISYNKTTFDGAKKDIGSYFKDAVKSNKDKKTV